LSGVAFYDDQVARRYDGLICARKYLDAQHPQELIRIRPERSPQQPLNPGPTVYTFTEFPNILLDEDGEFLLDENNTPIFVEGT
jgi:hypothetical protein